MISPPNKLIIDDANFLRLDGSACCKVIVVDGVVYLEFFDRDRLRSSCRGDQYLRITLKDFAERIAQLTTQPNPPLDK